MIQWVVFRIQLQYQRFREIKSALKGATGEGGVVKKIKEFREKKLKISDIASPESLPRPYSTGNGDL